LRIKIGGYEKKNAEVQEAHRDVFADFKVVSSIAIFADSGLASPGSRLWPLPVRLRRSSGAGWLAWREMWADRA